MPDTPGLLCTHCAKSVPQWRNNIWKRSPRRLYDLLIDLTSFARRVIDNTIPLTKPASSLSCLNLIPPFIPEWLLERVMVKAVWICFIPTIQLKSPSGLSPALQICVVAGQRKVLLSLKTVRICSDYRRRQRDGSAHGDLKSSIFDSFFFTWFGTTRRVASLYLLAVCIREIPGEMSRSRGLPVHPLSPGHNF